LRDDSAERGGLLYAAERIRCGKLRSSSRADGTTTSAHRNTHLSMSLQRTGFADRDAIPRGVLIDLTGQRFGRLTVIRRGANSSRGLARFECVCDCGGARIVAGSQLRRGTRSCGCLIREHARELARTGTPRRKHGHAGGGRTPEYRAWRNMKSYHGGRGIRICDEWHNSFEAFYAHVGPRPSPQHSIDRINNDGDYRPGMSAGRRGQSRTGTSGPERATARGHRGRLHDRRLHPTTPSSNKNALAAGALDAERFPDKHGDDLPMAEPSTVA
jgi:hypothetical protein